MSMADEPNVAVAPALPGAREAWRALRGTAGALIVGIVALGGLFHAEVTAAINTWIDSTAYNHCFLVIPIVAFLIWDRRGTLLGLAVQPVPLAALAGIPLVLVWLFAERLGIMEGRQLVVLTFLELLLFGIFGWRLWRALSGPLLYLYFLVPVGEFLTPKLQDITTVFVRHGLDILNIPAYIDGYVIEIPEGTFFIAQACAGLRFLIASVAFGVLYALMMYRSPVRRLLFILLSVIVPIIANGFRALGIVSLGHILGSAQAAATDHVLYGWIFFSIVILLLLACGLPFREDDKPDVVVPGPPAEPGSRFWAGGFASALLVAIAATSPATAALLDRSANRTVVQPKPLEFGAGCAVSPGAPPARAHPAAVGRSIDEQVVCTGGRAFAVHIVAFSSRSTSGPVLAERRRLSHPPDIDETTESWLLPDSHVWRLVTGSEQRFAMAVGLWIDGAPASVGLSLRARMARSSLTGGNFAPILVAITPIANWDRLTQAEYQAVIADLADLLSTHPGLSDRIDAMTPSAGQ